MAKLLLLGGGAIIVAMLLGRLRRLLGIVVMLCAAAAAAAVFLLPLDGETLWERARREGLPDDVKSEAAGAWKWIKDKIPGEQSVRKKSRKGTEPLARARDRLDRWDDRATPEGEEPEEAPTPKEHLSPGDHEALDKLISGHGR
jgi:hypothetical protein